MLRKPSFLVDSQCDTSTQLIRSIEDNDVDPRNFQIRWGSISSTQPVLSGPEQIRVYHEWIDAGKPHNIVCWECRLPDSLIGCQTCCRSYHTACLLDVVRSADNFHCPSCRARSWDDAPPQFPVPSPIPSTGGTTPKGHPDPSFENLPIHGDRSSTASRSKSSVVSRMMPPPTLDRIDDFDTRGTPAELFPVAETYPQLLEYLAMPDAEVHQHVQSSQFKHQLGMAMKEIESNRASVREKTNIREEYSKVQRENAQIKAYLDSRSSSRGSSVPSPSAASHTIISRPTSEQMGKDWDRIAVDLF
ncbi:Zinc finger PHD-finger [Penicillium cf. griseofulvum]|uniref:Zinc finger PHD-finger n=1 Tax=Penicillium cf. griseofulvum TaxID=2972120 RepID=A0A9W9MSB2_9EURO|nr:Zinc finger PHD-finger [Penicillium cf. griseofulvum]KAJ5440540.1 Zinc finger PHD-finger [Penicillium cf. griseofulvum]KAJ5448587.1 Zinc finger PHD-finger [Penicillium cf. griseofulvum]